MVVEEAIGLTRGLVDPCICCGARPVLASRTRRPKYHVDEHKGHVRGQWEGSKRLGRPMVNVRASEKLNIVKARRWSIRH